MLKDKDKVCPTALFTDTAAILLLPPQHPIILLNIYSFVVIMNHYLKGA